MSHVKAADLPAHEPTDEDLIDLLTLPWDDSQGHLEHLLTEAGLIEIRRQLADVRTDPTSASVHQLPACAIDADLPEGRAA